MVRKIKGQKPPFKIFFDRDMLHIYSQIKGNTPSRDTYGVNPPKATPQVSTILQITLNKHETVIWKEEVLG